MATQTRHLRTASLLALLAVAPLSAQTETDVPRLRPQGSLLRHVVSTAFARSATFRALVDRIEHSDVIVHLTCEAFSRPSLRGRTALVSSSPSVRYLRIQVRCQEQTQPLVAIVAHELQHVAEIAATPRVIDDRSFATLFRAIGFATGGPFGCEQFETSDALDMEARVRAEWRRQPAPTGVTASLGLDRRAAALPALPAHGTSGGGPRTARTFR
jgi:hypothetical protein